MTKYIITITIIIGVSILGYTRFINSKLETTSSNSNKQTVTATSKPSGLPTTSLKPSPSQTPKATPQKTPSKTPTPSPTALSTVTPTPTLTPTPSFTPTPIPSVTPTPTPTATPIPEPVIQSVYPTSVTANQLVHILGVNFTINGISQIQAVKIGIWSMPGFGVQDDKNITTSMQVSNTGTFDVSVVSLDGTISTLPNALTVNP